MRLHLFKSAPQVLSADRIDRGVLQFALHGIHKRKTDVVCRVKKIVGSLGDLVPILGKTRPDSIQKAKKRGFRLTNICLLFARKPQAANHLVQLSLVFYVTLDTDPHVPVDPGHGVKDLLRDKGVCSPKWGKNALPDTDGGLDPGHGHGPLAKNIKASTNALRKGGRSLRSTKSLCPRTEAHERCVKNGAGCKPKDAMTSLVTQAAQRLFAAHHSGVFFGL